MPAFSTAQAPQPHMKHLIISLFITLILTCLACGSLSADQDEDQKIQQITNNLLDLMNQQYYKHGNSRLRMAHVKQHGCVRGTLNVIPNLPLTLAQGIFDVNKQNSSYPAFVRFSNGEGRGFVPLFGTNTSDAVPDTRGFAIKLFGVKGPKVLPGQEGDETQDFLMITTPTNFLQTLDEAVSFFQAAHDGATSLVKFFAVHPIIAADYARLAIDGTGVTNVLSQTYWGEAAITYGNTFARVRVEPCNSKRKARSVKGLNNFLREHLAESLSDSSACFTFAVQLYKDPKSTPLNDATADWTTPWNDVAWIEIPAQTFLSRGQDNFCDFMAFNPYHAIQDHKPVSSVQKLRGMAYAKAASYRHQLLGQPDREATWDDWLAYPNM
jgi:catalase